MAEDKIPMNEKDNKNFSPKFFETETKVGTFQKAIHWITSFLEMALTILLVV